MEISLARKLKDLLFFFWLFLKNSVFVAYVYSVSQNKCIALLQTDVKHYFFSSTAHIHTQVYPVIIDDKIDLTFYKKKAWVCGKTLEKVKQPPNFYKKPVWQQ